MMSIIFLSLCLHLFHISNVTANKDPNGYPSTVMLIALVRAERIAWFRYSEVSSDRTISVHVMELDEVLVVGYLLTEVLR